HSGQLSATIDTTSPGRSPRATSPSPAWRAASPYSRQLTERHTPRSFSRIATLSPRSRTTCQKSFGSVSCPRTVHRATRDGDVGESRWTTVLIARVLSSPPSPYPLPLRGRGSNPPSPPEGERAG